MVFVEKLFSETGSFVDAAKVVGVKPHVTEGAGGGVGPAGTTAAVVPRWEFGADACDSVGRADSGVGPTIACGTVAVGAVAASAVAVAGGVTSSFGRCQSASMMWQLSQ